MEKTWPGTNTHTEHHMMAVHVNDGRQASQLSTTSDGCKRRALRHLPTLLNNSMRTASVAKDKEGFLAASSTTVSALCMTRCTLQLARGLAHDHYQGKAAAAARQSRAMVCCGKYDKQLIVMPGEHACLQCYNINDP